MEIDLGDLFSDVNKVNEYLQANTNIGKDLDLNDVFGRLEAAAMSGWQTRDRIREVVQNQIISDLGLIKKKDSKVLPALKSDLLETAVKPSIGRESHLMETVVEPSVSIESVTKRDLLDTSVKPSISAESVRKNKRKKDEPLSTKYDLESKKLKICKFASLSLFDDAQNITMTNENQPAPVVKNDERMAISSDKKEGNVTECQFRQKPNVAEVICNDELKPTTPKHLSVNGAIRANDNIGDGIGGTFIVVSDDSDDENDLAVVGRVGPIIEGSSVLIPHTSSSTASVDTAVSSNPSDSGSTSSSSASSSTASVAPANAVNSSEASLDSSSPTSTASVQNCNTNSLKSRICMRRIVDIASSPGPSKASSPGPFINSSPGPSKASSPGPFIASSPGPSKTSSTGPYIASSPGPFIASSPGPSEPPPNFNIVTRSTSVENNANSSSGNSNSIACSVGNDLSGPEEVAKQLEDMFPHFSPEYLLEKAKKYVTIENAVDELLNEAAFEESSKVKYDEMKCMSRVAKSLLLLGEEDMFKKVTLTEKRDFNPEDPLENKFRLAKGHYLSVSGQFASPIESIDYVENRTLMENFERKKSEFKAEGKDTKEYLMFHGTNDVNVDSILKENFRMDFAGKHGQAHGRGIYFSEKTIIPNQYMNGAKKTLLLCRVLLGREFLGLDKDIPKGFDSKSVERDQEKRANINIIKEVDQILPCFVLNLAPSSGPGLNVFHSHQIPFPQFNIFPSGFMGGPSGFMGGGIRINRKKPKNGNPTKK